MELGSVFIFLTNRSFLERSFLFKKYRDSSPLVARKRLFEKPSILADIFHDSTVSPKGSRRLAVDLLFHVFQNARGTPLQLTSV